MANKRDSKLKSKNLNQPKENRTIAEKVQLRIGQLDQKSSNISKQIDTLQKRLDDANKLRPKIEKLKGELAKVKKTKELELDEISLMCGIYAKQKESQTQKAEPPKTKEDATAEAAYAKLS